MKTSELLLTVISMGVVIAAGMGINVKIKEGSIYKDNVEKFYEASDKEVHDYVIECRYFSDVQTCKNRAYKLYTQGMVENAE